MRKPGYDDNLPGGGRLAPFSPDPLFVFDKNVPLARPPAWPGRAGPSPPPRPGQGGKGVKVVGSRGSGGAARLRYPPPEGSFHIRVVSYRGHPLIAHTTKNRKHQQQKPRHTARATQKTPSRTRCTDNTNPTHAAIQHM